MGHSPYLHVIGIMTGNSLDGADFVLCRVSRSGAMVDLATHREPFDTAMREALLELRDAVQRHDGDVAAAERELCEQHRDPQHVARLHTRYLQSLLRGVRALAERMAPEPVDLIGLHGQTCGHRPPSAAPTGDRYTLQFGNGQELADLCGISVVYDFRSDDLMAGGEAAPLAPVHHEHLAHQTREADQFPIAFCNAGNTGNFTVVSQRPDGSLAVVAWDAGPCNHFPDLLMRTVTGEPCDRDGAMGARGSVQLPLVEKLFDHAVTTADGKNFLLLPPPKSSDPQWYQLLPELVGDKYTIQDRVRTVEFFSAYTLAYSLSFLPPDVEFPRHIALCGGGWQNPIVRKHFEELLSGNRDLVLPRHQELFAALVARAGHVEIQDSMYYGFDGTVMEARIFADAAVSHIRKEPFSRPDTTGVAEPTVAGVLCLPNRDLKRVTESLQEWIAEYDTPLEPRGPIPATPYWNRATRGWQNRG